MAKPKPWYEDNDPFITPAERADWIAVLPLGAHEQHGPHLPFETDTLIANGIARVWRRPCLRHCRSPSCRSSRRLFH